MDIFPKVNLLTSAIIVSFMHWKHYFFRQYTDVKHQLESQGEVLTLNLAYNAEPFIADYDKDQLNQF